MERESRWLEQVLSICVGTPYHSYLDTGDDSEAESDPLEIVGTTLFQLDDGALTFQFFAKETDVIIDLAKAFARGSMMLRLPDQDFVHPIEITGESQYPAALKGVVASESFGTSDAPLSGITIWLVGLPCNWGGADRLAHYEVTSA